MNMPLKVIKCPFISHYYLINSPIVIHRWSKNSAKPGDFLRSYGIESPLTWMIYGDLPFKKMFDDHSSSGDFPLLFHINYPIKPSNHKKITIYWLVKSAVLLLHHHFKSPIPMNHHKKSSYHHICELYPQLNHGNHHGNHHFSFPVASPELRPRNGAFFWRSFCRSARAARRSALASKAWPIEKDVEDQSWRKSAFCWGFV